MTDLESTNATIYAQHKQIVTRAGEQQEETRKTSSSMRASWLSACSNSSVCRPDDYSMPPTSKDRCRLRLAWLAAGGAGRTSAAPRLHVRNGFELHALYGDIPGSWQHTYSTLPPHALPLCSGVVAGAMLAGRACPKQPPQQQKRRRARMCREILLSTTHSGSEGVQAASRPL